MPSIMNGLFAGRAGIASHGTAIAVLADNISNANTTGYKAARAEFTDMLAGNLGGGSGATVVGSGSTVNAVTQVFSQGTFEFTGRGLDLGIDGQGFFILDDNGSRAYSRAGNFKIDEDGNLLNQNGLKVLGFPADGSGGLQALNVNDVTKESTKTTTVTMAGNLNASTPTVNLATALSSPPTYSELKNAAAFSTAVSVYDSLGVEHNVTVWFFHTASNQWTAQAYGDSGDFINGGSAGSPVLLRNGTQTLTFDSSGKKISPAATSPDFSGVLPPATLGTPPAASGWLSGADSTAAINFYLRPFTQQAKPSTITSLVQDGKGGGNVVTFNVESDGTLFAQLDNGQSVSIGVIGLASFANAEGLRRTGESLYTKTTTSGEAVIGTPGTGMFGGIQAGALELSTSDIAADFIKLISLQRGFQGSSRIITSISDLLNEVINLAR